jgi:DNA-3-methyladenine glycosylase II
VSPTAASSSAGAPDPTGSAGSADPTGSAGSAGVSGPSDDVVLTTEGPFDFDESSRFLAEWMPAAGAVTGPRVAYAFCSEVDWQPLAVSVSPDPGGGVRARTSRPVGAEGRDEIARTFSLDVDGTAFVEVAQRDPVIGRLQAQRRGLRPVCFWSTWEAAAWAVLVQRTSAVQTSNVRRRLIAELGSPVTLDGVELRAFPSPAQLLERRDRLEVPIVKRQWLCDLAEAALEGVLDASRLRALSADKAMDELRELDGIGPFSAALIVARGAGHPDMFTTAEPRLAHRMAEAYGPLEPSAAVARAEAWRPFRSWASFLLRSATDEQLAEAAPRAN